MRTKEELPECPVATAVSLIGGKWKLLLLRNLKERPWRFNELQRSLDGISQKVLTESLRQIHEVVQQVYDALKEKGYNPVNQLVGYILSEDPTYITTYKGARSLIRKVDRDDLLQAMLRSYLNV